MRLKNPKAFKLSSVFNHWNLTMDLLKALNWRYATKKMDPTKSVPEDKVQRILEAIRLTATSSGLQPYEVFVVTNTEVRAKIQAVANNQAQITEGSHLLVFAAWNDYTPERINMMFDYNNEVRGFVNEGAENYRQMLLKNYPAKGPEVNFQHAAKQSYIALGTALIAAAEQEVDATPMEGFNPAAVDEILGLAARGLRSTVILPLGYREADKDWLVNMKKVRRTTANFITEVK
jgi:nitroreductase